MMRWLGLAGSKCLPVLSFDSISQLLFCFFSCLPVCLPVVCWLTVCVCVFDQIIARQFSMCLSVCVCVLAGKK